MAYINRKQTEEAIRKYADQKHSNGEQIEYVNGILKSISVINEQPAADVVEVKHGEWSLHPDGSGTCNLCGRTQKSVWDFDNVQSYCVKCGAKMDGGKTE